MVPTLAGQSPELLDRMRAVQDRALRLLAGLLHGAVARICNPQTPKVGHARAPACALPNAIRRYGR
jgi:hypothetical protein